MTRRIEELIDISAPVWPGKALAVQPGDLRLFAPSEKLDTDLPATRQGAQDSRSTLPPSPLLAAPLRAPAGGTVYLHGDLAADELAKLLRLLQVDTAAADYAAFLDRAADPFGQRYLTQLRLVRSAALSELYGALSRHELPTFPAQRLTIGELLPAFVAAERVAWETGASSYHVSQVGPLRSQVAPALGFGFMVENAPYGVYRIWSRPWLDPR
jgi:hypothetical protein